MLSSADQVFSLYLHIPFCKKKCAYCDFASGPFGDDEKLLSSYVEALTLQLDEFFSLPCMEELTTAYIGGGTPSVLGAYLPALARSVSKHAHLQEFSCEANPESTTRELLSALKAAGVSRMSFGVQSLDARELKALGRIHTAKEALRALTQAHELGFDVSCDLMCAIPLQTSRSWKQSLLGCVDASIDHISVYPLAIEPHTAFWKRYGASDPDFNSDRVQAARMVYARDLLCAHGFSRYEVASYAKPGHACAHNLSYWEGKNYLGVGVHASSMLSHAAFDLLRRVCPQLPRIDGAITRVRLSNTDNRDYLIQHPQAREAHFDCELLTRAQALAEDLMLAARTARGIDCDLLDEARAQFGRDRINRLVDECVTLGLLCPRGRFFQPSEKGWLMGNYLFEKFWDLADESPETYAV